MRYVTAVDAWGACGARERCLGLRYHYRGMRRNTSSWTSRETEALLDHLVATCTSHLRRLAETESPYIAHAPMCCLHLVLLLILRATRAPYRPRAGPPSNCGVAVSADVTHDELLRTPQRNRIISEELSGRFYCGLIEQDGFHDDIQHTLITVSEIQYSSIIIVNLTARECVCVYIY